MPYVYLLSDYEEHGSDNVVATTDRDRLFHHLVKLYPWIDDGRGQSEERRREHEEYVAGCKETLAELLRLSDEELAVEQKYNLGRGWGGVQLRN
jgi:hypothetical protein